MLIRAGRVDEAVPDSGVWLFVDMGFAQRAQSCGLLYGDGTPVKMSFADMCAVVTQKVSTARTPINLVVEAPLSVAFNIRGNPTGRSIEKRGSQTRYWYTGLGCAVMVAATYLMRELSMSQPTTEVRLFEGLVSFKERGVVSSHCMDVLNLRAVVWHESTIPGNIVAPEYLAVSETDRMLSAFAVAGMDFGVPPVIVVGE